jgi:tyrosyl-DNA phosphodiesterase-1
MKSIAWFLLTSANLSKAAWGQVLSDGKFRVRSYELGVLFVSPQPGKVYRKEAGCGMLVPYSLPPRPYSKTDKPWIADITYSLLDTHGNKWPIDTNSDLLDME